MKCPNCENEVAASARKCNACGYVIGSGPVLQTCCICGDPGTYHMGGNWQNGRLVGDNTYCLKHYRDRSKEEQRRDSDANKILKGLGLSKTAGETDAAWGARCHIYASAHYAQAKKLDARRGHGQKKTA